MSVLETFFVLNAFHCAFPTFHFQVSKTQLFLLGLLILNLSFVRVLKLNVLESCFDGLNQSHFI